jgi:uncharacterized protein (TIGR00266 family)
MRFELRGNPDYGHVVVELAPGERVLSEGGAMSRMSASLELRTRLAGGLLRALARKVLGGESFFLAEYSGREGGQLVLSPRLPGAVVHRRLDGGRLTLTGGSFLAAGDGVELRTRFGGLKSLFSGEGAFLLDVSGQGELFFNTYGALVERDVDGELVVDTGHVVGWEPTLDYTIGGMGGLKQTLFSGEGLVMRFRGRGRIWLQTRTLGQTAGWLVPYLLR